MEYGFSTTLLGDIENKEVIRLGYKSKTIKCSCGHDEFFVDTMGIEHCSKCFAPTMYIHSQPTGGLSYKQLNQAKDLENGRLNEP